MPSSQLAQLTQQIEAQNTDHFGKFYMYVSLLNTLTRDKTFSESLPKYRPGIAFWRTNHLNIGGELPAEFTGRLIPYAQGFANTGPNWTKTLQNLVLTYFRKGKISDLVYIIDQMLYHLEAASPAEQNANHEICNYINFYEKKAGMIKFIREISIFNQQLLAAADSGVNVALAVLVAATGLAMILSISFIPLLIGLPILALGAYGIYHYVTKAKTQAEELTTQLQHIKNKMAELPQDDSLFGDKNYAAFYAAALMPLPYAAIRACEQLTFKEAQERELSGFRADMDNVSDHFPI